MEAMDFLVLGRCTRTNCCPSSPPSWTRTDCGLCANARLDGNRDDKSKYILDTIVWGSIPDSSPGRFREVIEAAAGSGTVLVNGIVLGSWDVECMGESWTDWARGWGAVEGKLAGGLMLVWRPSAWVRADCAAWWAIDWSQAGDGSMVLPLEVFSTVGGCWGTSWLVGTGGMRVVNSGGRRSLPAAGSAPKGTGAVSGVILEATVETSCCDVVGCSAAVVWGVAVEGRTPDRRTGMRWVIKVAHEPVVSRPRQVQKSTSWAHVKDVMREARSSAKAPLLDMLH